MKDYAWFDHLAALSFLSFEGEERELMAADMESVLQMMDTIKDADLSEEMVLPNCGMELLREDRVNPSLPAEEILANAKGIEEGMIAVPKWMD